jgi:hypothetical protein
MLLQKTISQLADMWFNGHNLNIAHCSDLLHPFSFMHQPDPPVHRRQYCSKLLLCEAPGDVGCKQQGLVVSAIYSQPAQ